MNVDTVETIRRQKAIYEQERAAFIEQANQRIAALQGAIEACDGLLAALTAAPGEAEATDAGQGQDG